ncbi:NUDIX domain-containing protein [Streptomyces desertarenae]|uniref:NUDIX domain-containing protein n=1 Tax=Streptomyces desertarenae TaxID=2666184 RepID=A0ABW4PQJ2_9ACTN
MVRSGSFRRFHLGASETGGRPRHANCSQRRSSRALGRDVPAGAGRELTEETGIPPHVVTPHGETPLHVDIHSIDANPAKSEPTHRDIDFRFLSRATAGVGELQTEEVGDAAWRVTEGFHDERLRRRVAQALR